MNHWRCLSSAFAAVIKTISVYYLCIILLLVWIKPIYAAANTDIANLGWGGGGAFTSVTQYNSTVYLASDVTGVWKQVNGHWQPFVEGLYNYNVTALVSFNKLLFAITTDELFVTDGAKPWHSTDVMLSTNRSVTDQVYSVSVDNKKFCVANRNQKIDCIDTYNQLSSYSTSETIINGVYFDKTDNNSLYFYSGSKLFSLDLVSKAVELKKDFLEKIVSIGTLNNKALISTKKMVFALGNLENKLLDTNKRNIINFFVAKHEGDDVVIISSGNQWHTKLEQFALIEGELKQQQHVKVTFDLNLPHRPYQKSLTKLLSVNQIDGKTWVTDFWGVYQFDLGSKTTLTEVTANAINTVATDLIITDKFIYVSTMDNGVVKFSKTSTQPSADYQALVFDKLKGHSWSLLHHNQTVYGVISPWNSANDFLFSYAENTGQSSVSALTNYESRDGKGTFWEKSFARKLVYFNGILSFRDGDKGGLVKAQGSTFESDEPERLGHLNKVYKALAVHNELLYMASCEGKPRMLALDYAGSLKVLENLPSGFCPFNMYSYQDKLYVLGSRKRESVIYEIGNDDIGLLLSSNKGSAFYEMAINPKNNKQIVTATISWSSKATSGLFISKDGGNTFTDVSYLLTHNNGVVSIKFDGDVVYILLKVGGLLTTSIDNVFGR